MASALDAAREAGIDANAYKHGGRTHEAELARKLANELGRTLSSLLGEGVD